MNWFKKADEKIVKVKFLVIYEGTNPPSSQQISDALVDGNIDDEGSIEVIRH